MIMTMTLNGSTVLDRLRILVEQEKDKSRRTMNHEEFIGEWKIFLAIEMKPEDTDYNELRFTELLGKYFARNSPYVEEAVIHESSLLDELKNWYRKYLKIIPLLHGAEPGTGKWVAQLTMEENQLQQQQPQMPMPSVSNSPAFVSTVQSVSVVSPSRITLSFTTRSDSLYQYLITHAKELRKKPGTYTKELLISLLKNK